eukprot:8054638-Pyramimonas_sp.AAC.1
MPLLFRRNHKHHVNTRWQLARSSLGTFVAIRPAQITAIRVESFTSASSMTFVEMPHPPTLENFICPDCCS